MSKLSKYCHFKHILGLIVHHESFKMTPKVNVSSDLHLLYLQSLPNTKCSLITSGSEP